MLDLAFTLLGWPIVRCIVRISIKVGNWSDHSNYTVTNGSLRVTMSTV